MEKIELDFEYLLKIIVHKEKNVLRALNGFLDLYKYKGEQKYLEKLNECISELKICSEKLDILSRECPIDISELKNLYSELRIDQEKLTFFSEDLHHFENLDSYFNPFLEFFKISVIAIKNKKEVFIEKEGNKIKVVLN